MAPTAVIGLGRGDGPVFQPLFDGLGTLDLDLDPAATTATMAGLRVFVGYSGWSPGQLEQELGAGGWLVVDLAADDPFSDDPARCGGRSCAARAAAWRCSRRAPEDPSTN